MIKEQKKLTEEFKHHQTDSGSTEVQIIALTGRIAQLNEHAKTNKKDYSSKFGLLKMVSKRRKLIKYLKNNDQAAYSTLLPKIGLKK